MCSAVAGVFGGVGAGGATDPDDSCDRRTGTKPEPFCQEIHDTVVGLQFRDDCIAKFHATAVSKLCPRQNIIGGCAIDHTFEDGSHVTDWFYDTPIDGSVITVDEIKKKCADPKRYEWPTHFVLAP